MFTIKIDKLAILREREFARAYTHLLWLWCCKASIEVY